MKHRHWPLLVLLCAVLLFVHHRDLSFPLPTSLASSNEMKAASGAEGHASHSIRASFRHPDLLARHEDLHEATVNDTTRVVDLVFTGDPLENANFGLEKLEHEGNESQVSPTDFNSVLNDPGAIENSLSGHRVLFIGTSFAQRIANEWFRALGVEPDRRAAVLVNPSKQFTLRRLFDGAIFSSTSEAVASAQYRAALQKAEGKRLDAARHDTIIVARASWDLAFLNTHPKDFVDSFLEALMELHQKWLTPDGQLVIYPHHSLRHTKVDSCLTTARLQLIRLATYSALRKFLQITGLTLSDGRNREPGKPSVVLFDIYNVTASKPKSFIHKDGHHLSQKHTKNAAESLLLQLFSTQKAASNTRISSATAAFLNDGFLRSIPHDLHVELDDFDNKTREDIPYYERQCMCGKSTSGVHPACRMGRTWFTWERRYLTVQHYLKNAYNGMSEMQMRELVSIICEDQSPLTSMSIKAHNKFIRCLDNMGATKEMSLDPKVPLQPRRDASRDAICLCVNRTTDAGGRANPRCGTVADRWAQIRRTCNFIVAPESPPT